MRIPRSAFLRTWALFQPPTPTLCRQKHGIAAAARLEAQAANKATLAFSATEEAIPAAPGEKRGAKTSSQTLSRAGPIPQRASPLFLLLRLPADGKGCPLWAQPLPAQQAWPWQEAATSWVPNF